MDLDKLRISFCTTHPDPEICPNFDPNRIQLQIWIQADTYIINFKREKTAESFYYNIKKMKYWLISEILNCVDPDT